MGRNGSQGLDYATIGQRIRQRRIQFGMSTEALAQQAGVARYTVVRMEKGLPFTRTTLAKVRKALRLFTDQITRPLDESAGFVTHRATETRWSISIPKSEYQKRPVDDDPLHVNDPAERNRLGALGFQPFFTAILESELPHGTMGQALMELHRPSWVDRHFGEEFVYCLRGTVVITVDGSPCTLEEGDAICFDAGLPHQYAPAHEAGPGEPPALILLVVAAKQSEKRKRRPASD